MNKLIAKKAFPWQTLLLATILLLAAIIPQWPALHGVYQWDDDTHLWNNPNLRDFAGLLRIWDSPRSNHQYYPLAISFFWIQQRLWGLGAFAGYHFTNMLLHAINAVLVWRLLCRLQLRWCFLVAFLFAIHPMTVDSVAWISELKTVLSTLFYLLAAFAWLRWIADAATRKWLWYLAMLALFAAGMLSKPVVCTFPIVMLLVEYWRTSRISGRFPRRALLGSLPLFAIALALGYLFVLMERVNVSAGGDPLRFSPADRILIAGRAILFYPAKILYPVDLLAIYPRWYIDPSQAWQFVYPIGVVAIILALWLLRKKITTGPLVAVLAFIITLAPALGFVTYYTMRFTFVADHYAYLALIPFLALFVSALHALVTHYSRARINNPDLRQFILIIFFSFILIPLTWTQASYWQTPLSLWEHTVAGNPDDYTARANLAWGYFEEGRLPEAQQQAEKSLALNPNFSRPLYTLGKVFLEEKRPADAVTQFAAALQTQPHSPLIWAHLGAAFEQVGHLFEAEIAYNRAAELDPSQAWITNNLSSLLLRRGEWKGAEIAARQSVADAPGYALARINLGFALEKQSQFAEAAAELQAGLGLMADENPRIRLELARTLAAGKNLTAAINEYRRVIAELPADPTPKNELDALLKSLAPVPEAATQPRSQP